MSAKAPGRPIFNQMLKKIEQGEADAILAWHPDRLARNSIDGGHVIYLLDRGLLKNLHFATLTFENNSQGKFMLSITFGYSKYYVDNLSDNVKRGNRTKLERGDWPNRAPIGYLNNRESKSIIPDPKRFDLVQQMWRLLLNDRFSPRDIWIVTRNEWGLTTPRYKSLGGGHLSLSAVYRIFHNPFYAGLMLCNGQTYEGNHRPMISRRDFQQAQRLLAAPEKPRPKTHRFAYTGLIRCGNCGLSITAEHKINRHGSAYIYYHCTKRHRPRCPEPSIEVKLLERQIKNFLKQIGLSQSAHRAIRHELLDDQKNQQALADRQRNMLESTLAKTYSQLENLTDLRVRDMIDDREFTTRRTTLKQQQDQLTQALQDTEEPQKMFEPYRDLIWFKHRAIFWFDIGDDADKRLIFQTAGSNPTLSRKILNVQTRKPFVGQSVLQDRPFLRSEVKDIRTPPAATAGTDELEQLTSNIKILMDRFDDKPK